VPLQGTREQQALLLARANVNATPNYRIGEMNVQQG
jgi:hypothetical protein